MSWRCEVPKESPVCNIPQGLLMSPAAPPAIRLASPSWPLHQLTCLLILPFSFHPASCSSICPRLALSLTSIRFVSSMVPFLTSFFPFGCSHRYLLLCFGQSNLDRLTVHTELHSIPFIFTTDLFFIIPIHSKLLRLIVATRLNLTQVFSP